MNVILVKEVSNLGNTGEIVKVKAGYARNYLLPRNLAVRESAEGLKILNKQKAEIEKVVATKRGEYQTLLDKLTQIKDLGIKVKTGEDGKIFGTITTANLADALRSHGIDLDRKQIVLKEHIKSLGKYTARVQLAKDFKADVQFDVIRDA